MTYTLTFQNNNPQVLEVLEYLKSLDFVEITKQKEPKKSAKNKLKKEVSEPVFSQEVLEASKVLQMTPEEIVAAANKYQMTPDDYAFTMMISKKINHNIAKRWDEHFNIGL